MAKGYWIAQSDVSDEGGQAIYVEAAMEYLKRNGAKTVVVSRGRHQVVEGSPRSRQIVQEFPNFEAALAAYHSEEYQEIRKLRQNSSVVNLVIVEGFDPTV